MKVYFLIPIYNEEKNISGLCKNLSEVINNYKKFYLFVDDCSTDGSVELIKNLFKDKNCHVITKQENKGPGDSFNKGFEWILEDSDCNDDLIITMEGDNTADYSLVHKMIEILKLGYELVLASPYAQGGGFEKTNIIRKALSFFANMVFRIVFDIKVLTLSSFYRGYKISLLRKIKDKYKTIIKENGFICMLEILTKAIKLNTSIIEIPMILKSENRIGKSKMKILKTGFEYLRFLVRK